MPEKSVTLEKYEVREQIGKGTFGSAFVVIHKDTRLPYVLKKIRLARQTEWQRKASHQEMQLVSELRHPFIVPYKESWIERGHTICIINTYCEAGDLRTLLKSMAGLQQRRFFSEDQLKKWLVQLLFALEYLHRHEVIHRDMKSSNVFLTSDGDIQVGDFGLSAVSGGGQETVGTPHYMCPELVAKKGYGVKADVWSLGVIMHEMSAQRMPFQAFNVEGLMQKILSAKPSALPGDYSKGWARLIRSMLRKEPERRPSVADLLRDPCLAGHIRPCQDYMLELMPEMRDTPGLAFQIEERWAPTEETNKTDGGASKDDAERISTSETAAPVGAAGGGDAFIPDAAGGGGEEHTDGKKASADAGVRSAVSGKTEATATSSLDPDPAQVVGRLVEEAPASELRHRQGNSPAAAPGGSSGGCASPEGLKTEEVRRAAPTNGSPVELPSSSSFLQPAGGDGTAAAEGLTSPKRPRTEENKAAGPSTPPPRPPEVASRLRELEGAVELCRRLFLQNKYEELGRVLEGAAAGAPAGAPQKFRVGETVLVGRTHKQLGTIRYSGPTAFGEGDWVGLELQSPVGRTDGSVNGVTYFKCAANQGIFVKASILVKAREQAQQADAPAPAPPGPPAPLPA